MRRASRLSVSLLAAAVVAAAASVASATVPSFPTSIELPFDLSSMTLAYAGLGIAVFIGISVLGFGFSMARKARSGAKKSISA